MGYKMEISSMRALII